MEQTIADPPSAADAAGTRAAALTKGCTLAAFVPYSGWNFECPGDGYLSVYRCGAAQATRRTLPLDAALAAQLRSIGAQTSIDDPERTRAVLRLFKSVA